LLKPRQTLSDFQVFIVAPVAMRLLHVLKHQSHTDILRRYWTVYEESGDFWWREGS